MSNFTLNKTEGFEEDIWPDLTLPPINLYNVPEIDSMSKVDDLYEAEYAPRYKYFGKIVGIPVGYKFICTDNNGNIHAYTYEPYWDNHGFWAGGGDGYHAAWLLERITNGESTLKEVSILEKVTKPVNLKEQQPVRNTYEGERVMGDLPVHTKEAMDLLDDPVMLLDTGEEEFDVVQKPKHYEVMQGVEAKDIIELVLNSELCKHLTPYQSHCLGNILKYRLRAGNKDALEQDIGKAEQYKLFSEE